jgi:hypothetical protein
VVVASRDDGREGVLKGSTANKEAVNIRLTDELSSVLVSHTSSVKDSDFIGCLLGYVFLYPLAHEIVGLLGLLRAGGLAGADGPHGLVGNNNLAPFWNLFTDGRKLTGIDLVGFTWFTLIKFLTDASHNGEASIDGKLGLLCDNLVGLSKDMASLGVTEDNPTDMVVKDHSSRHFAGVCAIAIKWAILGSHLNVGANKGLLDGGNMEGGGSDYDLNIFRVKDEGLQNFDWEFLGKVKSAIAFPVAADKVSSKVAHMFFLIKLLIKFK